MQDDQPSDEQLIDRTLAGQRDAFGLLVQRYQDRLYNNIAHVTATAEDGRDVVQEAFLQAYLKLDTFQRSSAFFTWLYRIAFNAAVSGRRRVRPSVSLDVFREEAGQQLSDPQAAPAAQVEQQERADGVHAALQTLSAEHRAILTLREMDGCSYEEIAELLELPVGTVRSRLHRARLQLKDQLQYMFPQD